MFLDPDPARPSDYSLHGGVGTGTNPLNGTTPNLVAYQKFRQAFEACKRETQHEILEHCTSYDWNPELPNPCNVVDAQNGCPHRPDFMDLPEVAPEVPSLFDIYS